MSSRKTLSLRSFKSLVPIAAALLLAPASTDAAVTVIDFEGFSEYTVLSTEIPGIVFQNARVLIAGSDLNSAEFPPFSGRTVVYNVGNPLSVDFLTPTSIVGGYFNYYGPVTLSFYGADSVLLGTVQSAYTVNTTTSDNPQNEYLQFSSLTNIVRMEASCAYGAGNMTLDSLTFGAASAVPEPASAMLNLIIGGTGIGMILRRRRR